MAETITIQQRLRELGNRSGEYEHEVCGRAADLIDACRAAGFIDENGAVRKVLGTLPVTADGFIVAHGGKVYPLHPVAMDPEVAEMTDDDVGIAKLCLQDGVYGDLLEPDEWEAAKCYSTREAARAAASSSKAVPP